MHECRSTCYNRSVDRGGRGGVYGGAGRLGGDVSMKDDLKLLGLHFIAA